jgi:hypothetical protein
MPGRVASLNVISPDTVDLFFGPTTRCAVLHHANSLKELREVLEQLLNGACAPCTLDLIGHSTRDHHLLRLGDERVDMLNPFVASFFRALAEESLLLRLGVTAMRLLGCETAVSPGAQRTLRLLRRMLQLPVYGTTRTLMKSHYDEHGFNPAFAHVLIEAAELT